MRQFTEEVNRLAIVLNRNHIEYLLAVGTDNESTAKKLLDDTRDKFNEARRMELQ